MSLARHWSACSAQSFLRSLRIVLTETANANNMYVPLSTKQVINITMDWNEEQPPCESDERSANSLPTVHTGRCTERARAVLRHMNLQQLRTYNAMLYACDEVAERSYLATKVECYSSRPTMLLEER